MSPVSTAARNSPNSGPRIAFKASVTPAPSLSRMRRVSPSRCNSLVASAARISAVRWACACLQTASRETWKRSATARFESPVAIARSICGRLGRYKSCSATLKTALALARLTQINREIAARFIHYSVRIASTIHDSTLPRQFKGLHDKDPAQSRFATSDFVSEPSRLRIHFALGSPPQEDPAVAASGTS